MQAVDPLNDVSHDTAYNLLYALVPMAENSPTPMRPLLSVHPCSHAVTPVSPFSNRQRGLFLLKNRVFFEGALLLIGFTDCNMLVRKTMT